MARSQLRYPVFALACLLALGLAGCAPLPEPALESTLPESVGLTWQECAVTHDLDWRQAEDCFGHAMPLWGQVEAGRFGQRVGLESLHLAIGPDTYEARPHGGIFGLERYTLYRNGKPIRSLYGEFSTYSPNIALQNIGGRPAWEFSDGRTATVIYNDRDLRRVYHVDRAYRPYSLAGKLVLVAEKDGAFFVLVDGQKVGPAFDEIVIAYCCEPVAWSVQYGRGRYLFWGSRAGRWYVVELARRAS